MSRIGIGGCFADEQIMKYGWDNGIRLFDSGWGYQGNLVFEKRLGDFLKTRERKEAIIVDKFPLYDKIYTDTFGESLYEMNEDSLKKAVAKIIETQLNVLGTDYIDYYLLHAIYDDQHSANPKMNDINFYKRLYKVLKSYKDKGVLKHLGFSAHITFEKLYYFVNETKEFGLDVAEVSYNVLNNNGNDPMERKGFNAVIPVQVWDAPGDKGIKFLKDNGFTVIDCMPHESGRLLQISTAPDFIKWNDRFILNNKNIDYVLTGTTHKGHLDDLLIIAGEKENPNPIPDMRKIEGMNGKKCCGE